MPTSLTATVPQNLISSAGTATVTVSGTTGAQTFSIKSAPPVITNVQNAATFQTTLAASTYAAIFGVNLSTTHPGRAWNADRLHQQQQRNSQHADVARAELLSDNRVAFRRPSAMSVQGR